jgi:hypothetical protein
VKRITAVRWRAPIGIALVAACAARAQAQEKTWRLTRDRNELWREDLRELSTELQKRHKNPFFAITKENWEKSVAELDARVPQLSDVEMMTAFMRLVASIGDGHTALQVRSLKPGMRNYPIAFVWLADGLFVAAAPADHRELIGGKVTKVGELDVDAALAKVGSALPLPNEASRRNFVPTYLALAEVLQGLGVTHDAERLTVTVRGNISASSGATSGDSKEVTATLESIAPGQRVSVTTFLDPTKKPVPLAYRKRDAYWSELLPESKTLFIQYNLCANDPKHPFADFTKEVMAQIEKDKVERVILDLRRNGGGDSEVANPLLEALAESQSINRKGRLFVLVGIGTLSSAQLNANTLRHNTKAILVGMPTGQKPNAYGEMKAFELKNSGIQVSYSTKYFKTEEGDPPSMMPDVVIDTPSQEYFAANDPPLDAILAGKIEIK